MPKLLPDQSFYPSPTMAMQAPVETLAYVALLNPDPTASDALAVLDVDPASAGYGAQIARVDDAGRRRRAASLSDGTRAARACARTRRTRTCSGVTSWYPACGRRVFTSSIRCPTRGSRASSR